MSPALQLVLTYTLWPVLATIAGGVVAAFRPPGRRLGSAIQHFAAGVVFAAVGTELLPAIQAESAPIPIILGFSLGVLVMLGVKELLHRSEGHEAHDSAAATPPMSLITTIGIDIFIDGLLIGVGFAAGEEVGVLLTIALTLELLFLGLSASAELTKGELGRTRSIAIVVGLALLVLLGAGLGATLFAGLTGTPLVAVLSFGVAALLYLVTEELLIEAHEVRDTPLVAAMFFAGFLLLFVLEVL